MAIVKTLKYFEHILLGHNIIIKTGHKNLTHPTSSHTADHILRQRLLLEKYGAEIEYIQGDRNVVADALSRIPTAELFLFEKNEDFPLNLAIIAEKEETDTQWHITRLSASKF